MQIYEKILSYLAENELSRASVAQKAGIPEARLQAILLGTETLYAEDLRAICLALGVPPETFINIQSA